MLQLLLTTFLIGLSLTLESARAQDPRGEKATQPRSREWTSSTGTQLTAKLDPMTSPDQVTLISENGRKINIKTDTLSENDQRYVRRIWYNEHPIARIRSAKPTIFYSPFYFFNEVQAKLDQKFYRLVYPAWKTLSNFTIKEFDAKVEALSPDSAPTLYLFDESWRQLLTGKNKSELLVSKIRAMSRESKFSVKIILVDAPIYGSRLPTTSREFTTDHQVIKKTFEQVDEFMKRKDLGPNITMVSTRKFKDRVQLLCPEWNIESREELYMIEAAVATVTTRSVPKLSEVQKAIHADLRKKIGNFIAKKNSFLALSDDSLLKIEKALKELISKK